VQNEETKRLSAHLKKFVCTKIVKVKSMLTNMQFVVDNCLSADKYIIIYAKKNKLDIICIATQGTGGLEKI